jgi:hypothetical protein
LGTTFLLKLTGMTLGFTLILAYSLLFEEIGGTEFWMLRIVASAILFQTFDAWSIGSNRRCRPSIQL